MADFVIYEDHVAPVIIAAVPVLVALKGGQLITDAQFPIPALLAAGFKMVQLNFIERSTGAFNGLRIFTTGTVVAYTPNDGTKRMFVEVIGGGGGGGGASFASSNEAYGGGGGGGGYAAMEFTYNPGLAYAYTVGAGGAGGANTGATGAAGGDSTFASEDESATGGGGQGGAGMTTGTSQTSVAGGTGGAGTGDATFLCSGSDGARGVRISGTFGWSGDGGLAGKGFGTGGRGIEAGANNGHAYGGGGGGAGGGSAATAGGTGASGIVLVWEYA